MDYKRKLLIVTGMMFVLQSASGCSMQKLSDMFSSDRRLPEGSTVSFGNRHVPALNPGGEKGDVRHAPIENAAAGMYPSIMKSPVVPVASNPMPSALPVTAAVVPSSPMAAGDPNMNAAPVLTPPPGTMPVTQAPQNVAAATVSPQVSGVPVAVATPQQVASSAADAGLGADRSTSAYPVLANVPNRPAAPSKDAINNDFNALTSEQKRSETDRKNLMGDPNARVMTSAQDGQLLADAAFAAPVQQTAVVQPPASSATPAVSVPLSAAKAVAGGEKAAPSEEKGFNGWFHRVFGSEKKNPAVEAQAEKTRKVPLENQADSTFAASPVPVVNASATPPASSSVPALSTQEQSSSQPLPVLGVENAPAQPQPAVETVKPVETAKPADVPVVEAKAANNEKKKSGSWMDSIFGSKKQAKESAPETVSSSKAVSPSQDQLPPVQEQARQVQSQASQSSLDAVPSSSPAISSQPLPNLSQLATPMDKPVNLVQPSSYSGSYSGTQYIEDSRYAERMRSANSN